MAENWEKLSAPQISGKAEDKNEDKEQNEQCKKRKAVPTNVNSATSFPDGQHWYPLQSQVSVDGRVVAYTEDPLGCTREFIIQATSYLEKDAAGHPHVGDFLNRTAFNKKHNKSLDIMSPEQAKKYKYQLGKVKGALISQADRMDEYIQWIDGQVSTSM